MDIKTIQIQVSREEYDNLKAHIGGKSVRQYAKFLLLGSLLNPIELVDMRNQGSSYGELAEYFKISKQRAFYLYKKYSKANGMPIVDKRKELGKARGDINRPKKDNAK